MSNSTLADGVVQMESESSPVQPTCCSFARFAVPGMALIAVTAICVAAYFAGRSSVSQASAVDYPFPPISATASAISEKYSMATGMVGDDAEGLYVLDHNSGVLQCSVIYPRMGQFGALFKANVAEALGTGGKGGGYIMVTGRADFPRASNRPAGACVLYVMDTATGNYAAYGIPFDRAAVNAGRQQSGMLVLLSKGSANPIIDRDNLR